MNTIFFRGLTGGNRGSFKGWHYGAEAYASIEKVMKLRESIRPYVSKIMAEVRSSGFHGFTVQGFMASVAVL